MRQSSQQFASIRNVLLPLRANRGDSVVSNQIRILPFADPIIEKNKGLCDRRGGTREKRKVAPSCQFPGRPRNRLPYSFPFWST